nr:methyltransferase, TIGR04325 family [Marinobacter sediminum]
MARKRLGITYRGIFDSFDQAQASAARQLPNQYDVINENKGDHLEQELPAIDKRMLDIDYPLLFWLSQLMKPSQTIWELGGSLGQSFYSFEHYFRYPDDLKWVIEELPAAVKGGEKIAAQRGEQRLAFVESDPASQPSEADIFLTAGTLQYMEPNVTDMLDNFSGLPTHVLIHNLPAHPSESFWTLQYLEVCEVPYKIHSISALIAAMKEKGYELIDQWKNPRQIDIPYHPDKKVEGYCGFYFRNSSCC